MHRSDDRWGFGRFFPESERLGELFADAPVQGLKTTEGDEVQGNRVSGSAWRAPGGRFGGLDEVSGQGFV